MAEDTVLEIGTVVDTGGLVSGMRTAAETVQSTTTQMTASMQELGTSSAAAAEVLGASIPAAAAAAAEGVTATIPPAAAGASKAITEMGAAGEGFLVRFKGAMAGAATSLDGLRERVILTGSGIRASLSESVGSFSSLGGILGVVLGAEIFEHFIAKTQETVLQLGHLSTRLGININELNGLKFAAESAGVSFDAFASGMTRLERAGQLAVEGGKQQALAFQRLRISVDELRGLQPDQLIYRIAEAMRANENAAQRNASALTLLGRGGAALIPVLEKGGEELKKQVEHFERLSPDMKAAYIAALQYQQQQAELSAQWQGVAIPAMKVVVVLVQAMLTAFETLALAVEAVVAVFATAFVGVVSSLRYVAAGFVAAFLDMKSVVTPILEAIADAMRGNFHAAYNDIKGIPGDLTDNWRHAAAEFGAENDRVRQSFKNIWSNLASDASKTWQEVHAIWQAPIVPDIGDDGLTGDSTAAAKSRISQWEEELNQKKLALDKYHTISVADELIFWEEVKNAHKLSSEEQQSVDRKLVELRRSLGREDVSQLVSDERTKVAATQSGTAQRLALETELLGKLRALAAGGAGSVEPDLANHIREQEGRVEEVQRSMSEKEKRLAVDTELAKVSATKVGTEARLVADQRYLTLVEQLYGQESTQYAEAQRKINADARKYQEERLAIQEQEIKAGEQIALLRVENEKAGFDSRVLASQKSSSDVLAVEQAFARQEYDIKRQSLEQSLALMAQDPNSSPSKMAAIKQQLLILEQQYYNQLDAIARTSTNYRKQLEEGMVSSFQSTFASGLSGLITGTQTFVQAWQNMVRGMVSAFTNVLSQMVTDFIVKHTIMRVVHQTFSNQEKTQDNTARAQDVVASQAAALQKQTVAVTSAAAIDTANTTLYSHLAVMYNANVLAFTTALAAAHTALSTADVAAVTSMAAKAAAEVYAYYAATDPPIAPAMAAKAFAEVAAYIPSAAAERGAIVPQDMPIFAHAKEMILPAPISTGLQQMISAGHSTSSDSSTVNSSFSLAYHAPNGAQVAPSVDARRFADMLQKELRRRNLFPG